MMITASIFKTFQISFSLNKSQKLLLDVNQVIDEREGSLLEQFTFEETAVVFKCLNQFKLVQCRRWFKVVYLQSTAYPQCNKGSFLMKFYWKNSNFAVYGPIELKFSVNDPWNFLNWILTKCQLLPALSSWGNLQKALILLFMV